MVTVIHLKDVCGGDVSDFFLTINIFSPFSKEIDLTFLFTMLFRSNKGPLSCI
jgi:hypothetical protein